MSEFVVTMHRDATPDERDKLGAAGLRVAYVGRDLGEGKVTSVIVVPAETEDQARERTVSLLALRRMKRLSSACIQEPQTIRGRTSAPTSEMAAA